MDDFTISGVLRQTITLLGRNAGPLALLALLLIGLPEVIGTAIAARAASPAAWAALPAGLTYLGSILLQIAVIQTVVGTALDRAPAVGAALGLAIRQFLPILAINILLTLGVSLAAILLVFPALMLACRWMVAVPAGSIERSGVFGPFRRSAVLTSGHRWRIFGLLLIFLLLSFVGSFIPGVAAGLLTLRGTWTAAAINGLSSALLGGAGAAGSAAICLNLRRVKEGLLSKDLVAVFD